MDFKKTEEEASQVTETGIGNSVKGSIFGMPLRDWVTASVTLLATAILLPISGEWTARHTFSSSGRIESCILDPHSKEAPVGIPYSICHEKRAEAPASVEYRFDSCGRRSSIPCAPKSKGTYRIVLYGSSMAFGLNVPIEKTFAARLQRQLSQQLGRPVEIYNDSSIFGGSERSLARHFDEIQSRQADLVLWALTPIDVAVATASNASPSSAATPQKNATVAHLPQVKIFEDLFEKSRTVQVVRHYLYILQGPEKYTEAFMRGGGNNGESVLLRTADDPTQIQRTRKLDEYIGQVADRSQSTGIPVVVTLLPNRALAAMIASGSPPAHSDPYALDNELRTSSLAHNLVYLDILPEYRRHPGAEAFYYPAEGHPNSDGHALIADFIDQAILRAKVIPLNPPAQNPIHTTKAN